ncbi:glycosyltransferase [Hyphobacterium sp. CCMP332]|uniref:glycosyltransferase n=1 Tax=Hyphobacterium sp. CCMP332 TaxID=2749086 RepID=UPI00164FF87B|nr:glycosyltransferase [Hyphobacterium sp. CCMP332]QNL17871.1 glycosyltransferase [Hyphobacterium sp. CCMP332]
MANIALFTLGDPTKEGGVQISTARLANFLAETGHRVTYWTHFNIAKDEFAQELDIDVDVINYRLIDTPPARQKIQDLADEYAINIAIIINSSQAAGLVVSALKPMGIPTVISERGGPEIIKRLNWQTDRQREFVHRLATHSHVLMPSYRKSFPEADRENITVIPSAVEYDQQPPLLNKKQKVVLYVGRFSAEKGVDVLIEGFSRSGIHKQGWKLYLVGHGPDEAKLAAQAKTLDGTEAIRFMGSKTPEQVNEYYRLVPIFVLPSYSEGCPLALREALGSGCASIGFSDCSGTNEIIIDKFNGRLVEPGEDRAGALADTLQEIIQDPTQIRYMRINGLSAKNQYDISVVHGKWSELIEKVLEKQSSDKREKGARWRFPLSYAYWKRTQITREMLSFSIRDRFRALMMGPSKALLYRKLFGTALFSFRVYRDQHEESRRDCLLDFILSGRRYQVEPWLRGLPGLEGPVTGAEMGALIDQYRSDEDPESLIALLPPGRRAMLKEELAWLETGLDKPTWSLLVSSFIDRMIGPRWARRALR